MSAPALPRIGLQTIIYGEDFPISLDETLKEIREMGFSGVEFFQAPGKLGEPVEFERLMEKHGLTLLGLTGGDIDGRKIFSLKLKRKPLYIYLQDFDVAVLEKAMKCGCHAAIHPIQYSRLDSYKQAVAELENLKNTRSDLPADRIFILPDSGHLYLGNESLADILERDGDKIRYVHLKDWTPRFGTSMFTYARGFCELGEGIVAKEALRDSVRAWHKKNDQNWIVVEQDSSSRRPKDSCEQSWNWLCNTTGDLLRQSDWERKPFIYGSEQALKVLERRTNDYFATKLIEALTRANLDSARDVGLHYSTILESFFNLVDLKFATIWEINPREKTAVLRSHKQALQMAKYYPATETLDLDRALCGRAVDQQQIIAIEDIAAPQQDGRVFGERKLMEELKLQSMVTIPIPNHWNPHQPEIIINLFPESLAQIWTNDAFVPRFQAALQIIKPFLSITIERAWEQERVEIHGELNWIAAQVASSKELIDQALEPIRRHLHCGSVRIYLLDESQMNLERKAAAGRGGDSFPSGGEQLVGRVRESRAGYNTGTHLDRQDVPWGTHLLTPIFSSGRPLREVIGVIWCEGKNVVAGVFRSRSLSNDFTVTDELTLDAAQAALAPHLARMLAAEQRLVTMSRINHELRDPIGVFRRVTTAAKEEMAANGWRFKRDHLGRLRAYLELMKQVVAKSVYLKTDLDFTHTRSRVLLFRDIIEPAIYDLTVHLEERAFSSEAIVALKKFNMPTLYVDQVRFQQVVFNVLGNAIKYAHPEPEKFSVEIEAEPAHGGANLIFRDNGIGIPAGMEEKIFFEGVRGQNALDHNVLGDGIGLFIVKRIVVAHGGTILARPSQKVGFVTEFVIFLPKELTEFPQLDEVLKQLNESTSD